MKFGCHLYGNLIEFSTDEVFIEVGWNFDKMEMPMHLDRISMAVALLFPENLNEISMEFR